MLENVANPLHCPVRLYEFYLSRCPESVKKRTDLFFLQPEQNVHTHSSHWYTSQPLESTTLQSMLSRIMAVKEVHQELEKTQLQSSAAGGDDSLQWCRALLFHTLLSLQQKPPAMPNGSQWITAVRTPISHLDGGQQVFKTGDRTKTQSRALCHSERPISRTFKVCYHCIGHPSPPHITAQWVYKHLIV